MREARTAIFPFDLRRNRRPIKPVIARDRPLETEHCIKRAIAIEQRMPCADHRNIGFVDDRADPEGAPVWLRWVMTLNPLSYGMAALRRALSGGQTAIASLPSAGVSWTIIILFGLVLFYLSGRAASRRSAEDLQ